MTDNRPSPVQLPEFVTLTRRRAEECVDNGLRAAMAVTPAGKMIVIFVPLPRILIAAV